MSTETYIELLKLAHEKIDSQAVRNAELEKQIDFKIKECQELASSCNRWKLQALKEQTNDN